ncbi:EthD family reductase [Gordonia desulfuricans]|uniref:EthD family reductase n=1 Tax=Gordonia desulfuricans TaxID=89051 RepID=A0A7K3LR65_9ACTN|nr:EthD family reductase [Gordonia desulfuricans]NDK90729.1 EthD family reductase [Gordonia desulfuricans]
MYVITVIYDQPTDPAAFDEYYRTKHLPLVDALPDVRRFSWGKCEFPDGSAPSAYAIAYLMFDSRSAALTALSSPAGQAATGDVENFATGGATILFSEQD